MYGNHIYIRGLCGTHMTPFILPSHSHTITPISRPTTKPTTARASPRTPDLADGQGYRSPLRSACTPCQGYDAHDASRQPLRGGLTASLDSSTAPRRTHKPHSQRLRKTYVNTPDAIKNAYRRSQAASGIDPVKGGRGSRS